MQTFNRRAALGLLAGGVASAALPAWASGGSDYVTLQVVATRYNQNMLNWLNRANRRQRVLETGPRIFDRLASGRYKPAQRNIPLNVFFWMRSGFKQSSAVRVAVNPRNPGIQEERVTRFWRGSNNRLKVDMTTHDAVFRRDFSSLPFATQGSLRGSPNFAIASNLTGYGLGWQLSDGFLAYCQGIMICPRVNTVWPNRTGGSREGIITTPEEISRWLRRDLETPTAGIMDSV